MGFSNYNMKQKIQGQKVLYSKMSFKEMNEMCENEIMAMFELEQ